MNPHLLSVGQCATLACLWEATAPKPGNVHRGADFEDTTFGEFVTSSAAIGPVFERAGSLPVGRLVLEAVQAMRAAVGKNTHLGAVLLLAPLSVAAAHERSGLAAHAGRVAMGTDNDDCRLVYQAIRLAAPGGLGKTEQADLADEPDVTLHEAMRLAAHRDLIARQYINAFGDVQRIADEVAAASEELPLSSAIVQTHVRQMARQPDSLIARKCGIEVAGESAARAAAALDAGPGAEAYRRALADLDFWLRSDGHRRNPGATADLIAAALFVLLVEGRIAWPARF